MFAFLAEPATVTTIALASLTAAGTVGVWAMRLEGRVGKHDTLFEEREKLASERHTDIKNDLEELKKLVRER